MIDLQSLVEAIKKLNENEQYSQGVIIKLNKKTASIKLSDGHVWNVSPGLLEKA